MPAAVEAMASITPQSALDGANADKKRNKLGYHRTSVACVHCRRRKIRCLVAPTEGQGRCENCIRLRKDCQFYPVDQQPPVEKKSRPSSRLETAAAAPPPPPITTPMSSSPSTVTAESLDFYQYPPLPMNASPGQDVSNFNPGAFGGTAMSGFTPDRPMGPGDYSGHPTMEAGVPWDEFTTISDPQMLATMTANKNQMMNMGPQMWNTGAVPPGLPPASPMSAASPMAGHSQPMNQAFTMQPDGTVWQVPPSAPSRTMSYPTQDVGSSYPNQFQQQVPPDLKRRMTTPAQSISAASQNSTETSSDMQNPSGSVSYSGPAGMTYTQWPNMNMSGMGVVPFPMYGDGVSQSSFTGNPPPMEHPGGGPGQSGP